MGQNMGHDMKHNMGHSLTSLQQKKYFGTHLRIVANAVRRRTRNGGFKKLLDYLRNFQLKEM